MGPRAAAWQLSMTTLTIYSSKLRSGYLHDMNANAKESDQRRHSWRANNDEMLRLGTLKRVESSGVDRRCRACLSVGTRQTHAHAHAHAHAQYSLERHTFRMLVRFGHDAVSNQHAAGSHQPLVCEVVLVQPGRVR